MNLLDIHTHRPSQIPGQAIENCFPGDFHPQQGRYYSVGFHPWYLSADGAGEDWEAFRKQIAHPQVLAVGEAGLDKLAEVNRQVQEEAFIRQIEMAESVRKPLIIHTVRTHNEIIQLRKKLRPANPWIIHGFRGKKEQALQLTDHDIYLSFGEKYQEEALLSVSIHKIFLETDESNTDIHSLYQQAADLLSLPVNQLIAQVQQNITKVFFSK